MNTLELITRQLIDLHLNTRRKLNDISNSFEDELGKVLKSAEVILEEIHEEEQLRLQIKDYFQNGHGTADSATDDGLRSDEGTSE
jgi:hypothetical protein